MAQYLKASLASLPQCLQHFQPRSAKVQLPPASYYVNRGCALHARYPRFVIILAIVVLLAVWRDILTNSWSNVAARSKAFVVVEEENPIMNRTLGVIPP